MNTVPYGTHTALVAYIMLNVIRTLGTVTLLMYALVSFPQPLVDNVEQHHTAQVGAHKFDRTRHFPLANGNSDVTSIVPCGTVLVHACISFGTRFAG